ncbi:hypothetical protein IFR04_010904 [Cadophora malorum]|uniref:Xylanolytic transcriptional activator regulatory domain-containing protein n=1 Tax=Cadophora malorum TaxID=108018 RepID=A0A8H7T6B8_9HELO|nr:hypothetical protein IFR04_010904 [Cadophora malorum]
MQGKSRLRSVSHEKEGTSYDGLIARVAQLEEMVRLPGNTHSATSSKSESRQANDNFYTPSSRPQTGSSVVGTSPIPGTESTRRLEYSEMFFPLSPCLIQKAIDAFFFHSHNQPYSFFCESRFRQRAVDGTIPDHVIYAVVASAARFMEDQYSKSNFGALCAQKSWDLLLKHLHSDTDADLGFVQATTLLALFDFTDFKSRSAWKKTGTAARIAQDLKFMFEPSSFLDLQEQEEQRRTFWSIYMLDGLTTCGRARPPAFHGHYCKTNLPCTDMSFQLGLYEETANLDRALSRVHVASSRTTHSPFARVILIVTILSRASQYLMQDINFRTERPPWDSDSDYAAIASSIFNFEYQVGIHQPFQEVFGLNGGFSSEFGGQGSEHIVFYYALYHLTQLKSKEALNKNIAFLTRHAQYWNNAKLMLEELQKFDHEAVHLQSLIDPEIVELNFDPDTIDRLYDIADYNVISRYQTNFDVATFIRDEAQPSGGSGSAGGYPGQWMQSLSDPSPALVEVREVSVGQASWLPDHHVHYASHGHPTMPGMDIQPQYDQSMPGFVTDQLLL